MFKRFGHASNQGFGGTHKRFGSPVEVFSATGGTIVDVGGYRYYYFLTSGTFIVNAGQRTVEYSLFGGNGGGSGGVGGSWYGTGGAGGTYENGSFIAVAGNINITVGAAGLGSLTPQGGDGGDSIIAAIKTATGGQGGRSTRTGGSNTYFNGGTNNTASDAGGGAGAGANGSLSDGGAGALGIDGVRRNGGGGGGSTGLGGSGGGVNGLVSTPSVPQSTSVGGGAGSGGTSAVGGSDGAKGVVILRHLR